jgi:hypothetical protein
MQELRVGYCVTVMVVPITRSKYPKSAAEIPGAALNPGFLKKADLSWAPVAHAYSPSYSRGRDQEDHDSKPA